VLRKLPVRIGEVPTGRIAVDAAHVAVIVIDQDSRPEGSVFAGRSAYFADPDGNMLEIIALAAMAFQPK
jgi:catechol 2,3-dioxygenase-like lactoylglutathione lyase family enzyme